MSEKKPLSQEQLEKINGGVGGGNEFDTSFNHQITADELRGLAIGTEILVSYSATTQCVGPFKGYTYLVPDKLSSLYIDFQVTRATDDLQSWIGTAPSGVKFTSVNVYRK